MGNQNGHSYGLDPTLHARLLQSEPGMQIYQDAQGEEFQKYMVVHDCTLGFDRAYQFRVNNRHIHLVDVIFAVQYPAPPQSSLGCTKTPAYQIVTERIPYRLAHLPPQLPQNALTLLQAALRGFRDLFRVHGVMSVRDSMIGITPKNQVKVWLNPNFAVNNPQDKPLSLKNLDPVNHEREMVHNIFDLISSKAENGPLWKELIQNRQHRNVQSFDEAIALVDEFITKKKLKVNGELKNPFNKQLYGKKEENVTIRSQIDKLEEINQQRGLTDNSNRFAAQQSPRIENPSPNSPTNSPFLFSKLRAKVLDPNNSAPIEHKLVEQLPSQSRHHQPQQQPQNQPSTNYHPNQPQPPLKAQNNPQILYNYQSQPQLQNFPQNTPFNQPINQVNHQPLIQPANQITFNAPKYEPFRQIEKKFAPISQPSKEPIKSHSVSIGKPTPTQFNSFQLPNRVPIPIARGSHIAGDGININPAGRSPSQGKRLQVRFNYTKQAPLLIEPVIPLTRSINLLAVNLDHVNRPPNIQISTQPNIRLQPSPAKTSQIRIVRLENLQISQNQPRPQQERPVTLQQQSTQRQQHLNLQQKQPPTKLQQFLSKPQQPVPKEQLQLESKNDTEERNNQIINVDSNISLQSLVNQSGNIGQHIAAPVGQISSPQEAKNIKHNINETELTQQIETLNKFQNNKKQLVCEVLQQPSYQIKVHQVSSEQGEPEEYFLDKISKNDQHILNPLQESSHNNKHPQTIKQQISPSLQHQTKQKFTPLKSAATIEDKLRDKHKPFADKLIKMKEHRLEDIPDTKTPLTSVNALSQLPPGRSQDPSLHPTLHPVKGKLGSLTYRQMRKMLLQTLQRS